MSETTYYVIVGDSVYTAKWEQFSLHVLSACRGVELRCPAGSAPSGMVSAVFDNILAARRYVSYKAALRVCQDSPVRELYANVCAEDLLYDVAGKLLARAMIENEEQAKRRKGGE